MVTLGVIFGGKAQPPRLNDLLLTSTISGKQRLTFVKQLGAMGQGARQVGKEGMNVMKREDVEREKFIGSFGSWTARQSHSGRGGVPR